MYTARESDESTDGDEPTAKAKRGFSDPDCARGKHFRRPTLLWEVRPPLAGGREPAAGPGLSGAARSERYSWRQTST